MIAGEWDRHTHITDKVFHHDDRISGVNKLKGGKTSFGLEIVGIPDSPWPLITVVSGPLTGSLPG